MLIAGNLVLKKPPKYKEVFIAIKLHENRYVSELRMKSGVMIQCKFLKEILGTLTS